MLPAMVLAAGLGTRLRPLTEQCAKALVPLGDRPALAHVLGRLADAGVPRVVVNAHHRAQDVQRFLHGLGSGAALSVEAELLGTAGGVARAAPWLGAGDVIVWNADIAAEVDLVALAEAHGTGAAAATLVVQPCAPGLGPLGVDRAGRVVRLRGERFGEEARGAEFLGVSALGAVLRARLPERGCLVADVWLPWLRAGGTLATHEHAGPWFDLGSLGRYLAANLAWVDDRALAAWVGPGANVTSRVHVRRSVVGEGALVEGSGTLERCVVWPGARAVAPLADAIVTPAETVPTDGGS